MLNSENKKLVKVSRTWSLGEISLSQATNYQLYN